MSKISAHQLKGHFKLCTAIIEEAIEDHVEARARLRQETSASVSKEYFRDLSIRTMLECSYEFYGSDWWDMISYYADDFGMVLKARAEFSGKDKAIMEDYRLACQTLWQDKQNLKKRIRELEAENERLSGCLERHGIEMRKRKRKKSDEA